jgi:hypothetical protein
MSMNYKGLRKIKIPTTFKIMRSDRVTLGIGELEMGA